MSEPIEELRERVTEILGGPNEAIVDALLVFATNEVARIAGGEMAARWQVEDAVRALLTAQGCMLDDWAEANKDRRRELWQRLHEEADRVREVLEGAHSPAEPVSPASTPTEATGGAREAHDA